MLVFRHYSSNLLPCPLLGFGLRHAPLFTSCHFNSPFLGLRPLPPSVKWHPPWLPFCDPFLACCLSPTSSLIVLTIFYRSRMTAVRKLFLRLTLVLSQPSVIRMHFSKLKDNPGFGGLPVGTSLCNIFFSQFRGTQRSLSSVFFFFFFPDEFFLVRRLLPEPLSPPLGSSLIDPSILLLRCFFFSSPCLPRKTRRMIFIVLCSVLFR